MQGRPFYSYRALLLLGPLLLFGPYGHAFPASLAAQDQPDITADATPEIQQVDPSEAAPGAETTVMISGHNFSPGAYVSFSDPAIHVISTRRASPTQLEAKLSVSPKAQPGTATVYVSNPASTVAQTSFTIAAAPAPAPPPVIPANNLVPSQPSADKVVTDANAPTVTKVDPPSAGRGGGATVKVTGKNFASGVKVAFSNPGIRVLETQAGKATELSVLIQIAADAATGAGSLFVVNPDDREAEAQFEVTTAAPGKIPAIRGGQGTKTKKTTTKGETSQPTGAADQSFSVYSLSSAISILQSSGKAKGTLTISGKNLKYDEGGNEVFSIPFSDIREVEENVVFGVKSGTFHVIVNTGRAYNFIASSLKPADTQSIVTAIQTALK
jgi:IPT/TIG domain